MAIICKLINATTWWVLNKDSDIQALTTHIMNEWVISDTDTGDFEVTAWQVASWRAFIEVTRTNTSPEEKFMVYVWNQQDEAKTLWSNKKIFIQIPLDNINDNTLNTNPTWSWIATIEVADDYPATDYYLSLAETDWAWDITDTRTFTTIKWDLVDEIATSQIAWWNWKVLYTNWSGATTELALWAATKVLTSNGTTSAPTFESPSVDINWLAESTSPTAADDMLVMYDKSVTANKKHLAKASVTNEWLVEMCTDAEATTWTDEERYINSKQAKDNYLWLTDTIVLSRNTSATTWTVDYTHWLGKAPKQIIFESKLITTPTRWSSFGSYSSTTNVNKSLYCEYDADTWDTVTTSSITYWDWSGNWQFGSVSATSTTNFTISWTKTWSPSWTIKIIAHLIA